jgi:hypothetical protein
MSKDHAQLVRYGDRQQRQRRAAAIHAENTARIRAERLAMANSWTGLHYGDCEQRHPNPEEMWAKAFAEMGHDYGSQARTTQARA